MALASGPAIRALIPGVFLHTKSGVQYRVYEQNGKALLSFERAGDPLSKGTRELLYYIGSNRTGRSYLFQTDGFLFESPVNWYAQKKLWDMAPAYQDATEAPLTLPVVPDCLTCHASGIRPPRPGTENKYVAPAIPHGGVTCERCHGDDISHGSGNAASVDPAKLPPKQRDAICMECHLEGTVAISRPGKHLYDFRPGDTLDEYIRYFVLDDQDRRQNPQLSQVEALGQSACKRKSGDRMSCMSCHDPHGSLGAGERVAFYRQKCLNCHGVAFGEKHHREQPDCTSCHMPLKMATAVAHTEATDHRILRKPDAGTKADTLDPATIRLMPFPPTEKSSDELREVALAWESLAEGGMSAAVPEANHSLKAAASKFPNDPDLLSALAFIDQKRGDVRDASELYRRALAIDPNRIDAASDLAVIEASHRQIGEAVKLWQDAFRRAPERSAVGMNLANVFCSAGQYDDARNYVLRVLEFNPDLGAAKRLLSHLNGDKPSCGP